MGWLYPQREHLRCLGCLFIVSWWIEELPEEAAVMVVNCALPFIWAFLNCSHLCSRSLQWLSSVWYVNLDWSCSLTQSLASWYLTACASNMSFNVSLVVESLNLQLLMSCVILLLSEWMPSLVFLSKITEEFISVVPEMFIFLDGCLYGI